MKQTLEIIIFDEISVTDSILQVKKVFISQDFKFVIRNIFSINEIFVGIRNFARPPTNSLIAVRKIAVEFFSTSFLQIAL